MREKGCHFFCDRRLWLTCFCNQASQPFGKVVDIHIGVYFGFGLLLIFKRLVSVRCWLNRLILRRYLVLVCDEFLVGIREGGVGVLRLVLSAHDVAIPNVRVMREILVIGIGRLNSIVVGMAGSRVIRLDRTCYGFLLVIVLFVVIVR